MPAARWRRRVAALVGPGVGLERDLRAVRQAEAAADAVDERARARPAASSDGVPPPR